MRSARHLSINTKLSLLVTVAGTVALLLSSVAFVTVDYFRIRSSYVVQLGTLADVLAANSTAALDFDDPDTAEELLASLAVQPMIRSASLYDADGSLFASYSRDGAKIDPQPKAGQQGHRFTEEGLLELVHPVVRDGQSIGTIHLYSGMADLYDQMLLYLNIVVIVMIVSLGGSILLSTRLQRMISGPILQLANVAQAVSAGNDYSVRVEKIVNDELGVLYDEFNNMLERVQASERQLRDAHDELEDRVEQRTRQLSEINLELSREIADRQRAEAELTGTQEELLTTARLAGMAEIAAGVLHNVGNVLNSINVTASIVTDRVNDLRIGDLERAVALIDANRSQLVSFLNHDDKGKMLPEFLSLLSEHLGQERQEVLDGLRTLSKNIEHVKMIVATQQSYADVSGLVEAVTVSELIDDAVRLEEASYQKHGIDVVRNEVELPEVLLEKQKLLQVLVNMLDNAKDAIIDRGETDRRVTVRTRLVEDGRLRIDVVDNGVGIAEENVTRIFSHGFTTKPHGHGFGLHHSANSASEMGGKMSVESDGPGEGATFTIDLPFKPAELVTAGSDLEML